MEIREILIDGVIISYAMILVVKYILITISYPQNISTIMAVFIDFEAFDFKRVVHFLSAVQLV